jgi:Copine
MSPYLDTGNGVEGYGVGGKPEGANGFPDYFPLSVSDVDGASFKGTDELLEAYRKRVPRVAHGSSAKLGPVLSKAKRRLSSPTPPNQQHQLYTILVILVGRVEDDMRAILDESIKAQGSLPLCVVVIQLGRTKGLVGTWTRAGAGHEDPLRCEIWTREKDCLHVVRCKPDVSPSSLVARALAGVPFAVENYFLNRGISNDAARS